MNMPHTRIAKKCRHKLSDILMIGLLTYLSNGEDYDDMVLFAKSHYEFVKKYCESNYSTKRRLLIIYKK